MRLTTNDVKRALALPDFDGLAAQRNMMPQFRSMVRPKQRTGRPRLGSVLTRRREDMNSHAGQVSFPGGRREDGEPFVQTALRETEEEVGVPPSSLTVLGQLTPIYILPSDYEVHPFVAWCENGQRPSFQPSDAEVAELLEVPLTYLLDPANRHEEPWNIRGFAMTVPFYEVAGHKVWVVTDMMLSELLERLRVVIDKQ